MMSALKLLITVLGEDIKLLIGDKFLLLPCNRVVLIIALGYVLLYVTIVN